MPCLPVSSADADSLRYLCTGDPAYEMNVDIRRGEINAFGQQIAFDLTKGRRSRLLDGSWDSLNLLLAGQSCIEQKLDMLPRLRHVIETPQLPT